jgi:hypothetical protein
MVLHKKSTTKTLWSWDDVVPTNFQVSIFFVSIFKGDYHPLSSINPSHKSQRFWWYHPIAIGSHLQAPARPQHGPRCGLCRGGWRASWSAEGMGFSWWWLGRNPKFVGPIHMSSSFCSIFVGFDCFIPLWDNREVKIHNSQLFWLEQGIMFDPEKSLVSLAHIIEGPLDFLMQKQISHI